LVTFDDVGGLRTQIEQVRELVECPLRYPEIYDHLGIEAPRGILFFGPPGVGKTYLAKAIANEIGAHFLYINGPEIVSSVHGGTEANLRRIFEEATEHSPSIVMIDELDAIVPHRDESGSQADVRSGAQLLSLLDGLISLEAVVVIGTTNRPNSLDPALRRPGRLDREIFIPPPNAKGREEILNVHTRRVPLDREAIVFLPELARMTHGFVGADLMELVRQAALNALRGALPSRGGAEVSFNQVVVRKENFVSALKKVSPSALRETPVSIPDTTWEDIGGLAKVIEELKEAVELPLLYPEAFRRLRIKTSTGVLLYGPPGTGKTMLAKAVARECGANFIAISGPEIFSKWLGQSEERIRHIFQMARQVAPTVVFFDQLDAIGSKRAADPANAARDRVVNQLLAELDGIHELSQIIVLAATNQIDVLDTALLRQGRFGLQIYVGLPDAGGRKEILDLLLSKLPLDPMTDWPGVVQEISQRTDGLSGAALSFLCERAKLQALREGNYRTDINVTGAHLRTALDRVLTERSKSEKSAASRQEPQSIG
jgi:transitional endoplasmic reticulum ATPase